MNSKEDFQAFYGMLCLFSKLADVVNELKNTTPALSHVVSATVLPAAVLSAVGRSAAAPPAPIRLFPLNTSLQSEESANLLGDDSNEEEEQENTNNNDENNDDENNDDDEHDSGANGYKPESPVFAESQDITASLGYNRLMANAMDRDAHLFSPMTESNNESN